MYPCSATPACNHSTSNSECLCWNYCRLSWENEYDYSELSIGRPAGVLSYWYDWFGYYQKKQIPAPNRQKFVVGAADIACSVQPTLTAYNGCLKKHPTQKYQCALSFNAWQKAQDCALEHTERANVCGKVCFWHGDMGPRQYVMFNEMWGVLPVMIILACLFCGRTLALCCRCARFGRGQISRKTLVLPTGSASSSMTWKKRTMSTRISSWRTPMTQVDMRPMATHHDVTPEAPFLCIKSVWFTNGRTCIHVYRCLRDV